MLRDMTLENPIRAIREISHDITVPAPGPARQRARGSARSTSSREYLEPGGALRRPGTACRPMETQALEHVAALRGGRSRRDPLALDREIDWVIKHKLFERYRARTTSALGSPRVALLDLQYHDISRGRGVFYLLQRRGLASSASSPTPTIAEADRRRRRRPPGPGCAASSSAGPRSAGATSPSTGCTSSSTTRPSAPCCARTRSGRTTSGSSGSSSRCRRRGIVET